tara:strand:- start:52 stop:471 length:420 start_codon:yes stop_codon:yes gene_type:complete
MRINVNRLCELAGIRSKSGRLLVEAKEDDIEEGSHMDEEEVDEGSDMDEEDDLDEEIEVDEKMLVQELRRAKRLMNENKRRKQRLQEMELKAVIDKEVKNVLNDLNLNSGWVYGKRKPKRSKRGYVNHGGFMKGPGFRY